MGERRLDPAIQDRTPKTICAEFIFSIKNNIPLISGTRIYDILIMTSNKIISELEIHFLL